MTKPNKGRSRGTPAQIVDLSLLSAEEQIELKKIAEGEVLEERKRKARDAYIEAMKLEALRTIDPEEELFPFTIDVAGHADRIMLDGRIYLHGQTYEFTKKELDTIRDICARTWDHEEEIGGSNRDYYRRPRHTRVGPNGVFEPSRNSSLMRV